MTPQQGRKLSRREFLGLTQVGLLTLLGGLPATVLAQDPAARTSRVILHAYNPADTAATEAVQAAMRAATDLSWLREGDSVFVKLACNSNLSAPAVTSPAVVEGVVRLLQEAGAGTVYAGDMSGAMFVRHLAGETIGSTRNNMRENGLLVAAESAGATIHCFEEVPFAEAFVPGVPAGTHHWGDDLQVAEILDRVDHIINLPRLGKHVLAGASLGLKNAVGWISDHSRMVLHRDGDLFQQRIAEINAIPQIADKTRLTLTLVDHALTTYGPDRGHHLALAQPVIIAAEDMVSHDHVALNTLLWARTLTPTSVVAADPYPNESNGLNWWFVRVTWGGDAAAGYRDLPTFQDLIAPEAQTHINYAYDLLQGGRPDAIELILSGLPLADDFTTMLAERPELDMTPGLVEAS